MPYRTHAELPPDVKDNLTPYAQDYREAFNRAWQEYQGASKRRGNESGRGRPQGRLGGGEAEIREGRRTMAG
jgi:cation transport regulator ChaB